MNLVFTPLDLQTVDQIAGWVYPDTGERLFMETYYESDHQEPGRLKGPGGCEGFAVYRKNNIFGLFEFTFKNDVMEIGCAIAPVYKGKGHGAHFVQAGIDFGVSYYDYKEDTVTLQVDISNLPAIRVYEKVGFRDVNRNVETIWMEKMLN